MISAEDIETKTDKTSFHTSAVAEDDLCKFHETVSFGSEPDKLIYTDIICIEHSNKLFISISSTGAFGTLIFAKQNKVSGTNGGVDDIVYTTSNLFGQYETTLHVFTRSLIEQLHLRHKVEKPLLVSIAVRRQDLEDNNSIELFKFYEQKLLELYKPRVD